MLNPDIAASTETKSTTFTDTVIGTVPLYTIVATLENINENRWLVDETLNTVDIGP